MKYIFSFLIIITIAGCNWAETASSVSEHYDLKDKYPAIMKGITTVSATPLSGVYLDAKADGETAPIILALDGGGKMLAEVEVFGNHSLLVTPKTVYCKNSETKVMDEVGNTFLDARLKNEKIVFQVYKTSILSNC